MDDSLLIPRRRFNITIQFIQPIAEAEGGAIQNVADNQVDSVMTNLFRMGLILNEGKTIIPPSNFAAVEITEVEQPAEVTC